MECLCYAGYSFPGKDALEDTAHNGGILVPVEEVHHKIPISQNGTHDRSNLTSLYEIGGR